MPSSLIQEPPIIWLHANNHSLHFKITDGTSIHMGDDTQIQAEGKGSIKLKHGVLKYVLCVPSLAANLLFVYQMTHTSPPKRVVFGSDSVKISDISTGKIIAKGVTNHSTKEYEFSHFLPYLELV